MKLSTCIRKLILPLVILSVFFAITTAVAALFPNGPGYLDDVFELLDLRKERNLATWFESVLLLICAASFVPLVGLAERLADGRRTFRWLFLLFAVGCVYLSADESAMIHEKVGTLFERATGVTEGSAIDGRGFSWLLVFGPIALGGLCLIPFTLGRVISGMPVETRRKRAAWLLLVGMVLCVPAVLVLEWLEACTVGRVGLAMTLTAFEESLELVPALCLVSCNSILSAAYHL